MAKVRFLIWNELFKFYVVLEESLEDEESFISSKYLNNDVSKELKRNLRLSPI